MTFFAASMVAPKAMSVPLASVVLSVRIAARSVLASSAPAASFRSASAKVSVMSVPGPAVSPSAGAKVGAAGPVASTVNVALAAAPWLPCASK